MSKTKNQFDIFGDNVFCEKILEKKLSDKEFNKYKQTTENYLPLEKELAEKVAKVMMDWAIEKGATHYSHWFQPLNGITAEKQTSFLSADLENKPIIEFPVEALIKGETDASSFPNGGLRSVFEARGLTKWDYTYPAFLKQDSNGLVLCIPTILEAPDGTSLDKRTPLLNSCNALNTQLLRVLKILGDNLTKETFSTVGIEQEYFLIKRDHFKKRKDLMLTGRTLFGKELVPSIGKHYMGSISENAGKYMKRAETELWKLGIPAKVKHNEVAPRQYELVPQYENLKLGVNHDFLTMQILQREARKEEFACLLHEKPFKGISGSGKHNNWSIYTNNGQNLFSYGNTPQENARFILIVMALISAVDTHADLIRATIATAGNDNRLSGHEAPTTIISMYLGDELTNVIEKIVNDKKNEIKLGETSLSLFRTNITDRNRTSPFAFIGNRFEFRMPGAYASVAVCNTVLNTIMAQALENIADKLQNSKDIYKDMKLLICNLYKEHSKIIYNGNSYSEEWEKEANKRGLKNIKAAPEAFKAFSTQQSINLFEKYKIYTKEGLLSRYNIKIDKYAKIINTEAMVMIEMAETQILPQCIKYEKTLSETIENKLEININSDAEKSILENVSNEIRDLYNNINTLKECITTGNKINDLPEKAKYFSENVKSQMENLRQKADCLEEIVPKELWPMPTYSDMLN